MPASGRYRSRFCTNPLAVVAPPEVKLKLSQYGSEGGLPRSGLLAKLVAPYFKPKNRIVDCKK